MNSPHKFIRILPPSRVAQRTLNSISSEAIHSPPTTAAKDKEMTMQKRKLGNSNLEVSAIGFGCMGYEPELRPPAWR
jgi:hypothetical protein